MIFISSLYPLLFLDGWYKVDSFALRSRSSILLWHAKYTLLLCLCIRFTAMLLEIKCSKTHIVQVVELEVHMTPSMAEVYQSIAELLDGCIKELRKSNRIDTSDLDVGAGLFKSFDDIVRRQLDSIWHTVNPRTKQVPKPPYLCTF